MNVFEEYRHCNLCHADNMLLRSNDNYRWNFQCKSCGHRVSFAVNNAALNRDDIDRELHEIFAREDGEPDGAWEYQAYRSTYQGWHYEIRLIPLGALPALGHTQSFGAEVFIWDPAGSRRHLRLEEGRPMGASRRLVFEGAQNAVKRYLDLFRSWAPDSQVEAGPPPVLQT